MAKPYVDRGIHRDGFTGPPVAIDVDVEIKYNAQGTSDEAWSYRLRFPHEPQFTHFLRAAGYAGPGLDSFHGFGEAFATPAEAKGRAQEVTHEVAGRYRKYLEAQNHNKKYTLTIHLDKTNPEKEQASGTEEDHS